MPKMWTLSFDKNGYRIRNILGLPIGITKTIMQVKVQRYKCPNKDCDYDQQERIPFVTGGCGYSHRFATYVIGLLKAMTLKDAANMLNVTWDTVKDIHVNYLKSTIHLRH